MSDIPNIILIFGCRTSGYFNMPKTAVKTAQDIQDDILRKMSVKQRLQLTWEFSSFLLKLNQLNKSDGIFSHTEKNSRNSGKNRN